MHCLALMLLYIDMCPLKRLSLRDGALSRLAFIRTCSYGILSLNMNNVHIATCHSVFLFVEFLVYIIYCYYLCSMIKAIIIAILFNLGELLLFGFFYFFTLVFMLCGTSAEPYLGLIWWIGMALALLWGIIVAIHTWKKKDQ